MLFGRGASIRWQSLSKIQVSRHSSSSSLLSQILSATRRSGLHCCRITAMTQPEDDLAQEKSCSWNKFSEKKLVCLERKILEVVKTAYKGWFVPIGNTVGEDDKIWTVSLNEESKNTPLVLLHGFAAGVGFWCLNFDAFANHRPVYAIDLLGFGRSSRPDFNSDSQEAEKQLVESLEKWREEMKLDRFILLGHSFGGYLATSYAINHPQRVKHLILADPWGFNSRPPDYASKAPLWLRTLVVVLYPLTQLNPLATVRAAGPWGPWLVRKMRGDIANKYAGKFEDTEIISDYIYQCNSQKPTGETAFHSMTKGIGWAKHPMINRIEDLLPEIPVTIIYGEKSWIEKTSGEIIKERRKDSFVDIKIVDRAGHHLHADEPDSFNDMVVQTCLLSDKAAEITKFIDEDDVEEEMLNVEVSVN